MKQSTLGLICILLTGIAASEPQSNAIDITGHPIPTETNAYDGLWVGTGETVFDSLEMPCGEIKVPIAFYIRHGVAKSLLKSERAHFEERVGRNGAIKFQYPHGGREDQGYGWEEVPIKFTGQLHESSGEGTFWLSSCAGKWRVDRKSLFRIKETELFLHKNKLHMLKDGKVKRILKPKPGRKFVTIEVSGDFFLVHVNGEAKRGGTLFYFFNDPDDMKKVGVVRNTHSSFGIGDEQQESKGVSFEIEGGSLHLSEDENVQSVIEPRQGRRFTGVRASGDFFVVHVVHSASSGRKATIVYHFNDAFDYSKIGVIQGTHADFFTR